MARIYPWMVYVRVQFGIVISNSSVWITSTAHSKKNMTSTILYIASSCIYIRNTKIFLKELEIIYANELVDINAITYIFKALIDLY